MAKTLKIKKENGVSKVIVDGNEIQDVVSFELKCGPAVDELIIKTWITDSIEVQTESK